MVLFILNWKYYFCICMCISIYRCFVFVVVLCIYVTFIIIFYLWWVTDRCIFKKFFLGSS